MRTFAVFSAHFVMDRALHSHTLMRFFFLAASLIACSSNPSNDDAGTDASSQNDVVTNDVAQNDSGANDVTFAYSPQWSGATAVAVYGAFGQSTDWTAPFLTLTNDGQGNFTGKTTLPTGQYLYVFKITGDAEAGNNAAKYNRFAIDPADSDFSACPQASPTFDANAPNPCSMLTVPQTSPPALAHVHGVVVSDGAPITGWLVEIEREEKSSHHFFVNRSTTKSDGVFDLLAAPGMYRVQVLHPTFLTESDAQRDPKTLAALRRDISSSFAIAAGTMNVPSAEIAFHTYAAFSPIDAGTLPTSFTWDSNGVPSRLDVYGTGMDGGAPSIGDPWYAGPLGTSNAATFDGGFNTAQANQQNVALGERYFWGIEENVATDAGVTWTAQSMVFDITWH
jgi:hypothetical protein